MDTRTLSAPLYSARPWMKFVAVMSIIYGAVTALSIVGILFAWLPIWMGVLLMQSVSQVEQAHVNDDAEALRNSLAKLRTLFTIVGVLMLIGIAFGVLGIIAVLSGMMGPMRGMSF